MRKLWIILILLVLVACVPKYTRDFDGLVMVQNYAVTETMLDKSGKVIGKRVMVPAKSEWAKLMDNLVKELADFVGLADVPILTKEAKQ